MLNHYIKPPIGLGKAFRIPAVQIHSTIQVEMNLLFQYYVPPPTFIS